MSGADRSGIVRELSIGLAERGIGIEDWQTDIVPSDGTPTFKLQATLSVPPALTDDSLRGVLEGLAQQMNLAFCLKH
jgi:glycine cleavage system regulatory protein